MTCQNERRYGWRRDNLDSRDFTYCKIFTGPLPPAVDLRPSDSPIEDQGKLGSCTAHALSGAIQFLELKDKDPNYETVSRLFIYYNERALEHSTNSDSGASLRDGIKCLMSQGVCNEILWPYDESKVFTKPPSNAYSDAVNHKLTNYYRISSFHNQNDLNSMKNCLASGLPFVFGFSVYSSFETTQVEQTGIVPMPKSHEQLLGGHAVCCVGYDDSKGVFIVRNSWGTGWGMKGYFTLPYQYLASTKLSTDFWVVQQETGF